jgi:hypothetical protein
MEGLVSSKVTLNVLVKSSKYKMHSECLNNIKITKNSGQIGMWKLQNQENRGPLIRENNKVTLTCKMFTACDRIKYFFQGIIFTWKLAKLKSHFCHCFH